MTSAVGIGWLGHASTLIEVDGVRLLTDPALRHWTGPLRRIVAPVDLAAVREIDAVLISHLHSDHAHVRSLRAVGVRVPVLAARGAGPWLRRRGLADVLEIGAGETHMIGAVRVSAVHAQHDERRWPDAVEVGAIVVSDAIRVAAIQLEESWRHSSSYARSPSLESQRTAERRGRLVVK
jgi:L-ascorbate metabolism protein UlaG (beta-lactamase superfamily)